MSKILIYAAALSGSLPHMIFVILKHATNDMQKIFLIQTTEKKVCFLMSRRYQRYKFEEIVPAGLKRVPLATLVWYCKSMRDKLLTLLTLYYIINDILLVFNSLQW